MHEMSDEEFGLTLDLVETMLRDERGISEKAYAILKEIVRVRGNKQEEIEIFLNMDEVDGRFYYPADKNFQPNT